MADEQTADDVARALTGLMDAHKEYDHELKAYDDYSWDYYGEEYIEKVAKAHETLATTLNAYIDGRVRAVLDDMGIHEHFSRKILTLG